MNELKCLLIAAILISGGGCSAFSGAPENANVAANAANVETEATPLTASANETTPNNQTIAPDALVKDLYKQHDAQKGPFFQTKNRALVDKYFDKNLADLIWRDAKAPRDGIGAIDADPLYNAQDTDIKKFAVGAPETNGDRANVYVTFDNYTQKNRFKYSLVKQKDEWKISNVDYGNGFNLVGIYKDYEREMKNAAPETATTLGEFEGRYQVGDTSCTVTPVKMAFEVRWAKGSGVEMFYSDNTGAASRGANTFSSANPSGKGDPNTFSFDDENYDAGVFYRADGREFPVKRIK